MNLCNYLYHVSVDIHWENAHYLDFKNNEFGLHERIQAPFKLVYNWLQRKVVAIQRVVIEKQ